MKNKEQNVKTLSIVEKKKIWLLMSAAVILIGIIAGIVRGGLNFGMDFVGGTKIVIQTGSDKNNKEEKDSKKKDFDKAGADKIVEKYIDDATTSMVDDDQYEIKSAKLDTETFDKMFDEIKSEYKVHENVVSQDAVGASIGKDLTEKSIKALLIAFVVMLIYIAIRFEFTFGLAALSALAHDVLVTLSIYAIFNISINSPFIAAILTIVGYSINATIVIFDRIRENRKNLRRADDTELANKSVSQTMSRSINTTLTTLFTIVAVFIFVPSVRDFAFPIIIGVLSGTYSSICIAPSLWVVYKKVADKRKEKREHKKIEKRKKEK